MSDLDISILDIVKGQKIGKWNIGEHSEIARAYCLRKGLDPHIGDPGKIQIKKRIWICQL
jgi:hypothetical protein